METFTVKEYDLKTTPSDKLKKIRHKSLDCLLVAKVDVKDLQRRIWNIDRVLRERAEEEVL